MNRKKRDIEHKETQLAKRITPHLFTIKTVSLNSKLPLDFQPHEFVLKFEETIEQIRNSYRISAQRWDCFWIQLRTMIYPLNQAQLASRRGQIKLSFRYQAFVEGKIIKFPLWMREDSILMIDELLADLPKFFDSL